MGYKILERRLLAREGRTVGTTRSLAEARQLVETWAPGTPDETLLYIRYSNPAKRRIAGYQEPNVEGYLVENGLADLV